MVWLGRHLLEQTLVGSTRTGCVRILPIRLRGILLAAFVLALSVLGLWAAQARADSDDDDSAAPEPSRISVQNGVVTLTLDARAQRNAGIVTASPDLSRGESDVLCYGTVLDGAPLAALASQYSAAKAQMQSAKAKLVVSKSTSERTKILYKEKQASAEQFQAAFGAYQSDLAAVALAQADVSGIISAARQAWGSRLADGLTRADPLVSDVTARKTYLVKVSAPPGAKRLRPSPTAPALLVNGSKASLTLVSIATSVNPAIQNMSYFYATPATNSLVPGLTLQVEIPQQSAAAGSVVPTSSIVWTNGKSYLYLKEGAEKFVRRRVEIEASTPSDQYVVAGLRPKDEVVVTGAQTLLSEQFRAQFSSESD